MKQLNEKYRSRKFLLALLFSLLLALLIFVSLVQALLNQTENFNLTMRLIETIMPFVTAVVGAYIGFNYLSSKKK